MNRAPNVRTLARPVPTFVETGGSDIGPNGADPTNGTTSATPRSRRRTVTRFLTRGPSAMPRRSARVAVTAAMVAGAALVVATALIHLHLWAAGYRHIPTIGPLFLAQSIAGAVVAIGIAATRRLASALVGAAFQLATAGGLLLSATVGIFGFHDGLDAPWASASLVVEGAGAAVLLATATILAVVRRDQWSAR
jgi:hypothetical protein